MLNNRIKYYRSKFKINQKELAEKIGCKKQYLSYIENNKVSVSIELALEIKKAFIEISIEKSEGKQQIILTLDDLFYLE